MIAKTPTSPTEVLFGYYGRKPPVQCLARLKTEETLVSGNFHRDMILVGLLRHEAEKDGSDVDADGNHGASLLNWLYLSSSVNPLPPHYRCPNCKKIIFFTEGDGWDLPPQECCGMPMIRDGHNIPIEVMQQRLKDPNWELSISIAGSFKDKAIEIIERHYKREFVLAPVVTEDSELITDKYVLIPNDEDMDILDEYGIWHTDSEEIYRSGYRVFRLRCDEIKEQIRDYRVNTGLDPTIDDLLTEPVLAATQAKLTAEIVEAGGMPLRTDSLSFSTLLRTVGYLKSEQTEANPVCENREASYSDVFSCREEVWDLLCGAIKPEYKISMEFVKRVAHFTRMGCYTRNRMDQDTEQVLRELGISDHWITQMKETRYLPGKSDLINYLLDRMLLTWFELQEGEEL